MPHTRIHSLCMIASVCVLCALTCVHSFATSFFGWWASSPKKLHSVKSASLRFLHARRLHQPFISSSICSMNSRLLRAEGWMLRYKERFCGAMMLDASNVQEFADEGVESTLSKLRDLRRELENVRSEHRSVNNISDELASAAQYGGSVQFQLAALKKKKLYLKDRIARLEHLLKLRQNAVLETHVNQITSYELNSSLTRLSELDNKYRTELPPEWLEIDSHALIGNGAYGEVYEASVVGGPMKGLRAVAKRAKVKRAKEAEGSSAQRYLEVEAYINDVLMAFCPEIAPRYLGICSKKGREWLVWEHAGTDTLEELLLRSAANGSLAPLAESLGHADWAPDDPPALHRLATDVARQLLACCSALERAGVAHRDVKPNNLLVRGGRLCLIDMGSAAAMGLGGRAGFDDNKACWTHAYAPPEQFIDARHWGAYDVYSVAMILVRVLLPPLWDGREFEAFAAAYHAAGYDLDAWLRALVARERLLDQADLDPAPAQGGDGGARGGGGLLGEGGGGDGPGGVGYALLAAESCRVTAGGRGMRLCEMRAGLEALDVRGGGLCWDVLQMMLEKDPAARICPGLALDLLGPEPPPPPAPA